MMRSIDRLLASRTTLKIISLIVAVLVWYYIAAERGTEIVRTVSVPLEFLNVPADMSISTTVRDVDIQVSGTRETAFSLTGAIASQVDLKGLEPGLHRRPIQAILPSGIRLVEVSPPFVDLELTRMGASLLPVRVKMPEDLPPGYRIDSFTVNPAEVLVKGPEGLLSKLENDWITPTLEQILEEEDLPLPVVSSPERDREAPFMIEPGQVVYSFSLVRGFPRRTVPVRVELRGEPDRNFQIEAVAVDPPEVMIQGPLESIDRIDQIFLEPIDVSGLSADTTSVISLKDPAEEVQIVQDASVRVKILLSERIESRLYARIPVRLVGRSIYPGWRVEPSEVSVYLEGTPSDLDAAEESGSPVEVVVDVTNLVSQKITVPVKVNIRSRGLSLSEVEPSNVTVFALTE